MSNRSLRFWARNRTNARLTAIAASALVVTLGAVSWFVWSSPDSPVREAADTVVAAANPLTAQNALLQQQLKTAKGQVASQNGKLKNAAAAAAASAAAHAKQVASLQQQLARTQDQLGALEAESDTGTGSGDKGSSGGKGSGSKTTNATKPPKVPAAGSPGGDSTPGGTEKPDEDPAAVITAPSRDSLLHPEHRYFGMYTEQAPFNWATLDATAKKIGVEPNVVGYFSGWDEDFRVSAVQRAWQQGRLPLMTWESRPIAAGNNSNSAPEYSLPTIIGGGFDAYLHQYAKDIVATGLPLAIRLDHEMNGTWYPWSELNGSGKAINGNNVGDYVKMWRHVHDIFQAEGANALVIWVWAPNIINNMQPSSHTTQEFLAGYYPGDDYVDWVGLSGYLRPPWRAGNDFTAGYTFDRSLDQLRTLTSKPIFLAEVGASETDGHKPGWVKTFFEQFHDSKNADIIGFSWFSLAITSYVGGERSTNDWRIDSRSDSLAAFAEGIADPAADFTLIPAD
ncbi:glycosyl hydrolase [Leifsonia sp. F6_8S_P_1B]|uniref:Glycosyl hydrolase n=1 Tax=Leifsonia williamsii TaxID=3035919 RepID=A0ABT8KFK0_9MICO|nr:glycosyl hydrolase [Leifsonia williamsii]MDN4615571.1 glycosyl hydrolase [Leifsonia williamsii]